MSEPLSGKVIVITGSTRGLGLAMAHACVAAGATVVVSSRGREAVTQAVQQISAAGGRVGGLACDTGDTAQVQALADYTLTTFGRLDVWVNNAGVGAPYGPTLNVPPARFEQVIRTNILGVYHGSFSAMQHFVAQGQGKLINLLGRGDNGPQPFQNAYASSKVWVRNFTKALAAEYKTSGVGVYGFNPGLVMTELLSEIEVAPGYETKVQALSTVVRLWGKPAEIPAQTLVWLASAATDGKTGLIVNQLGKAQLIRGVLQEGWRRLTGQAAPDFPLHVRTLEV